MAMYTEPVMRNYPHVGSFPSDGSSAYLHAAGSSNDPGTAYTTAMTHVIKPAPQPQAQAQAQPMFAAPSSPQLGMFAAPSTAAIGPGQLAPAPMFAPGPGGPSSVVQAAPAPRSMFAAPSSPQGGMFAAPAPSSPTPSPFVFVAGPSNPPPPELPRTEAPSAGNYSGGYSGGNHNSAGTISLNEQARLEELVRKMVTEQQEMRYELNRMNYHCDDNYNKIDSLRNDVQAKYDEMGGSPYSNRSMEQTRDAVFAIPPPSEGGQEEYEPGGHFSNPLDANDALPTTASVPGQPRKPAKPPRNLDFEGSTEIINSFKGLLANPGNRGGDTTSSKGSRVRSHSKRKRFCGCF